MSSEKRPPGGPGARRRRPPTIDLEATEVASAASPSVEPPATAAPAEPAPQPERAPEPPKEPFIPPPPVWPAHAAFEPPPPPPPEPPRRDPPEPESPRRPWLPPDLPWPLIAAGASGVAGTLLVILAGWLAWPSRQAPVIDLSPRIAAIEAQLRELAARPLPASVDPKAIEDVAVRIARIENAQATPRAPVTDPVVLGRVGATESALKSLADNVAALARRGEENVSAQRETLARIDAVAAALNELRSTTRSAAVAAGSDHAVRLAVTASALRAAVERGAPFAAELAVVKPLAGDAPALVALEPFAASGVPNDEALARELLAAIKPLLRSASTPPRDGGFLDRLQANAEKLVRIRPVDEAQGDDTTAAVLARAETRAAQSNVAGALAELAKLSLSARAPVQAWIDRAEARNKALDVSRRFAADAVAALKSDR